MRTNVLNESTVSANFEEERINYVAALKYIIKNFVFPFLKKLCVYVALVFVFFFLGAAESPDTPILSKLGSAVLQSALSIAIFYIGFKSLKDVICIMIRDIMDGDDDENDNNE